MKGATSLCWSLRFSYTQETYHGSKGLRKWRLWTVSLLTFLQLLNGTGVMSEVQCYQCVWKSSGSVPSTGKVEDLCRPQNFTPEIANIEKCAHGCITSILYEYDPDGPTTTPASGRQQGNRTKPPMSFFMRGCPKNGGSRTKTGCEEKSYQNVYQEECFCTSDLCNGNEGSDLSPWSTSFVIVLQLITLGSFVSLVSSEILC